MDFFESAGVPLKIERGERVFPQSDHASDITRALEREMRAAGVDIKLCARVKGLIVSDGAVRGVETEDGRIWDADAVIVATGGQSYPSTGSTGDGWRMA